MVKRYPHLKLLKNSFKQHSFSKGGVSIKWVSWQDSLHRSTKQSEPESFTEPSALIKLCQKYMGINKQIKKRRQKKVNNLHCEECGKCKPKGPPCITNWLKKEDCLVLNLFCIGFLRKVSHWQFRNFAPDTQTHLIQGREKSKPLNFPQSLETRAFWVGNLAGKQSNAGRITANTAPFPESKQWPDRVSGTQPLLWDKRSPWQHSRLLSQLEPRNHKGPAEGETSNWQCLIWFCLYSCVPYWSA